MNKTKGTHTFNQTSMLGIFDMDERIHQSNFRRASAGQNVLYTGNLNGGPRYGSHGIIKQVFLRKAIVDLGISGTWHIPHFLLSTLEAA